VINTGKKKHQYTQTKNGTTYSYYRKSLTINGKTRTITASNAKEWAEKAETAKKEAGDNYEVAEKKLTVKQLAEVFKKDGESYVLVTEPRLYNILENPSYVRRETLRMASDSPDFGLFAFTFGVY